MPSDPTDYVVASVRLREERRAREEREELLILGETPEEIADRYIGARCTTADRIRDAARW